MTEVMNAFENAINFDKLDAYMNSLSLSELKAFAKRLGVKEDEDYPDWYGIPNIKFIYQNNVETPKIKYKGKTFYDCDVEDAMWERWVRDDDGNVIPGRDGDYEGFEKFMRDNADEIYDMLEMIMMM